LSKPYLIIAAGCNGSGKSTFSKDYVEDITPFDFDKRLSENYSSLSDSELRSRIAQNQTKKEFETEINYAFDNYHNFCFETNFHGLPVYWAQKAKDKGYHIELHFYCLNSLELAKERVFNRTKNQGHYVDDETIDYKWKEGYKNLNKHFGFFDRVLIIDNSSLSQPENIFTLIKSSNNNFDVEFYTKKMPKYAKRRFPKIYEILIKNRKSKSISNRILTFFSKTK
jgi:predicted ABC-type ATPase